MYMVIGNIEICKDTSKMIYNSNIDATIYGVIAVWRTILCRELNLMYCTHLYCCIQNTWFYVVSVNRDVQVTHAMCTNAPITDAGFWTLFTTTTIQRVPLLLNLDDEVFHVFQKTISNFDSSNHRTVFHFTSVHLKSISTVTCGCG